MKITDKQAVARVHYWAKELALLGVGHFRIEDIEIAEDLMEGSSAACVLISKDYDRLQFWIDRGFLQDCGIEALDRTLIHEWVHAAMRDYDFVVESIEDQLAPSVADIYSKHASHARENLVDRIATAIQAIHSKSC